ncbi:glutathione S-transferase [Daedaleopsis nitida]|nr:glutathione S-transferase [Daedaleopsis nitida]
MAPTQHLTLYTAKGPPPNGWKVMFVLEELGLEYKAINLDFSKNEHKSEEHTKLNPNGRIPTLIDHNNDDFVVWESNAIIAYLVDKYDTGHNISCVNPDDRITQLQWLFFQASGQGAYFGQAAYFTVFAPEKIPSAIERYQKEIIRVLGVLEATLSTRKWLVGDKCGVADLSFLTWNHLATTRLVKDFEGFDFEKNFPAVYKWHNEMLARPAVKKVFGLWVATM